MKKTKKEAISKNKRKREEDVVSASVEDSTDTESTFTVGDDAPEAVTEGVVEEDGFSSALSKLLSTRVDEGESAVLSKRKAIERKLEDERLEKRARAIVRTEIKELREASHQPASFETANEERLLRKIATRGVVQLFNAVHQHQVAKEKAQKEKEEEKGKKDIKPAGAAKPALADMKSVSKSSFLELLKMGGTKKQQA